MHQGHSGWLLAITLAMLAVVLPVRAELVVGRDYVPIIPAQMTDTPAKIEVIEFFSYGCPHCSDFHPIVGKWAAALPSDVTFKRVPVTFGRPPWASLARLFYALEATGDLAKLDSAVFDALHKAGSKLYDDKSITAWVAAQGVDAKRFTEAYNSFAVVSKAKRADQMVQTYKIQGVPAMTVDGKYLVTGKELKGLAELPSLTDQVIGMARTDRKKK
ncbi:MAG TPA: thiol:disulfide interchange protein DsbA/DsbL [Accumulibacter sp.]|uniref:Thiol:disulfide interchange protein n=2 Tax=Candidatus Accumulibacter TaxID=327159 RepID=A0A080MCS3_9PROT|nr:MULTISPECIES: thiol:disulfide interchange protein DsbA/DsbL [Candidatus Accumulibacter]KFB78275.1 MAG: Thiol:disulfide interchange protein DsbA precursor [Candidatus Accumulibacter cognatus]MBN8516572.1 thiol:disulfide interchange protein DsbA/DsbL [Accumulibacter sp.]MBO3710205.1 thiol:disulfide interchange protein DsbA/DsbL [Accumulibacter sp.]MCC2867841.1 thiol:disulfide interchange protein DsbA/DsbL [Candidatus Accumulibacter phosphatis]MCM8581256.1 thiol:disulfide interchange protein D